MTDISQKQIRKSSKKGKKKAKPQKIFDQTWQLNKTLLLLDYSPEQVIGPLKRTGVYSV